MSRRSSRLVLQSPSAEQDEQQKKRANLSAPSTPRDTKRQKPGVTKSTETKSKYFENPATESSELSEVPSDNSSVYETSREDESEGEGSNDTTSTSEGNNGRQKPKKRGGWGWAHGRKRSAESQLATDGDDGPSSAAKGSKGTELWREGVKTGLGPGKEVFIKTPKARDAGDTPYENHTIHPNTLLFLKDLKANNDREWMKMHDPDYRTSKKDWDTFVESLSDKIIEKDSTIPELPAKDLVFRIYRDVRFSNDPTPYKPHFSAAWSRTGRKGPYAAYYVHLEPGHCFIGSGLWMPDADRLALLREDVDRNSHRLKQVLTDADVRKEIFDGIPNEEKKAVKAFVSQNQEGALKTKPKGYDADNKNIDLLRLRSFTMGKKVRDEDLLGPEALDKVAHIVGIMVPFVTYLNSVVMPDPDDNDDDSNQASSADDGDDAAEDEQ